MTIQFRVTSCLLKASIAVGSASGHVDVVSELARSTRIKSEVWRDAAWDAIVLDAAAASPTDAVFGSY